MTEINKVEISPNGPILSRLAQGYWRLAEWNMTAQERLTFMKQHIELGVNCVDHADIYGSYQCEILFGEALKLDSSLRDKMKIVTKCGIHLQSNPSHPAKINHYDSRAEHIINSVNNSLSRLQTESIDLLLLHRPDFLMDADEVAGAFETLRASGKVKHFGVSNFTASQFLLLQSRLDTPLATNQIEINPLRFNAIEDGTLDLMQQLGIRPLAWSCLAGGEIFTSQTEQAIRLRSTLNELAIELERPMEQIIYSFVHSLPSRPISIVGTGKIERVKSAIEALSLTLNQEQWYRIWVANKGHGVP